jgi:hypothetical protein
MSSVAIGSKEQGGIYAGISVDGKHEVYVSPRMVVNAARTLEGALNTCKTCRSGGYDDWILPSVDELHHIFKQGVRTVMPYSGRATSFWTGTIPDDRRYGTFVTLSGDRFSFDTRGKTAQMYVRAIRYVPVSADVTTHASLEERVALLESTVSKLLGSLISLNQSK